MTQRRRLSAAWHGMAWHGDIAHQAHPSPNNKDLLEFIILNSTTTVLESTA